MKLKRTDRRRLQRTDLVPRSLLLAAALVGLTEMSGFAVYDEPLRPLFHYNPPHGWCGDPNGMVYYNGEYHFCYQWNPEDSFWVGHKMHWGHAISTDLVQWTELPEPIYPTNLGEVWSGSSVVDWNNSAGFGAEAMLSFYTSAATNWP